jgi:hypothetical protein
MKRRDGITTRLGLLAVLTLLACGCPAPAAALDTSTPATPDEGVQGTLLPSNLAWHGDNHARLEEMISTLGSSSAGYDSSSKPVAIFDWDNTVIKNDIGDAYLSWMLHNDKVLQPPGQDWTQFSPWLSPAAIGRLDAACSEHPAGEPLPTSTDADCVATIFGFYEDKVTEEGEPAWLDEGYDHRSFVPALALPAQIQAGYTLEQLDGFADQVVEQTLNAELGSLRTVGHSEDVAWIRIYDESRALIGALQEHGFDVWIVSASPEPVVRAFARRVHVDADHVIGIRSVVDDDGELTYDLQGCGSVADGDNTTLTFVDGKRCFVNQEIFGVEGPAAMEVQTDPTKRPAFVAGDATTDVSMLRDATALRLVINRQRTEVMCHAYHDADGRWLVNPMYIEPLGKRAEAYPCSTSGCVDSAGAGVPCLDDAGAVIPDQVDQVFAEAPTSSGTPPK